MVSLLVLEDESHHQRDHRVTGGGSQTLVLSKRVEFTQCVALHGIPEPFDRSPL